MRKLRVLLKRWLSKYRCIVEFCKDCGVEQPIVWHADNALWLQITGEVEGILCPKCFSRRGHEQGLLIEWTPTIWGVGA